MTQQEIENQKNIQYTKMMHAEAKLKATDYKVIKNAEAAAMNIIPLPYDVEELHNFRQSLRDIINVCEAEINRLNSLTVEEDVEVEQ